MAKITAAEVNKLRKHTGAGMMDCKKALVEAEGDFELAIEVLRKKGQKVAAKRADRDNTEGAVIAVLNDDSTKGALISLNCETDFVAMNEDFVKLVEQTGVVGEKIEIKAYYQLEAPLVGAYIHAGNKIAAMTALSANVEGAAIAAKDVSMQAAAMNPVAMDETGVDQATIEKEIEIAKDQLRQEGKPEAMLDKIAQGKLKRFFKDNTLVNQIFIKDNKKSVADYVKSYDKDLKVIGYVRVGLGA